MSAPTPDTFAAEVVIAGGGPAGLAAAVAAAEAGARVLLFEQCGFLGGAATAMLVPAFCPFSDGQRPISSGIGLQVLRTMQARLGDTSGRLDWVPIDAECLKSLYDEMLATAGVQVLLHHLLVGCEVNAGRVESLLVANKAGLRRVTAPVFVDATGDGDLAYHAGAEYEQGGQNGEVQAATLCFVLDRVDRARWEQYGQETGDRLLPAAMARAKEAGDLTIPDLRIAGFGWVAPDLIGMNFGHVYDTDGTNPEHLTAAMQEGRRLIPHLLAFLRAYVPGFENARLLQTAPMLGVRETRRVLGDYYLTLDDYVARRTFPDDIARNSYFIDLHAASEDSERLAGHGTSHEPLFYQPGESHGIPYRCLTPRSLQNVLVAGRCLSSDRLVNSALRVMPPCFATGEAAGVAAALAVPRKGEVRAVSVTNLQDKLRQRGVRVDA